MNLRARLALHLRPGAGQGSPGAPHDPRASEDDPPHDPRASEDDPPHDPRASEDGAPAAPRETPAAPTRDGPRETYAAPPAHDVPREDARRPPREAFVAPGTPAPALHPAAPATVDPRLAVPATTPDPRRPAPPAPDARRAPAEPAPRVDPTRVRGSAWGQGSYRLFVRRPPVAPPARNPVAPATPTLAARNPVAPATPTLAARNPVAPATPTFAARSPVAPATPTLAARILPDVPAAALPDPPSARAPAPRLAPAASHLSLGTGDDGCVRRVVAWPLALAGRPGVLGGALARLALPDAPSWRSLAPRLLPGAAPGEGGSPVVFLDVETTALGRGAGALAFMVGVAAFVGGDLRVEQWILTHLSAEPAMLAEVVARVAALAAPGAVLATFNGGSFDLPLLRTRLQRARLDLAGLARPHLDLLPLSRRMWAGRGPDCRLATLERARLGVRRVDDIAGHEIPAVFWAWLRRPDDPEARAAMQRVADHNLVDLVSLPALGAAIGRCLDAPPDLEAAVRAAELHRACGRPDAARTLLAAWRGRPAPAPQRRRALLLAAELLRRDPAARAEAAALWAEVCALVPGDPVAHDALAKHLEHHAGDPMRALEVARASATPCPRRLARLQRKLARAAAAADPAA